LFLVQQLAAGDTIDLHAHFSYAILISKLHRGLARNQPREDVIMKCEIRCSDRRPDRHNDERTDDGPESDRAEAEVLTGMCERKFRSPRWPRVMSDRRLATRRAVVRIALQRFLIVGRRLARMAVVALTAVSTTGAIT